MPDLLVERDGHLLILTMNRPKRMNALSGAMLIRMFDAYEMASRDPNVRCILVTGSGGNFCSGADLKAMSGRGDDSDPEIDVQARLAADPEIVYKALFRHYRPARPIIAAVELGFFREEGFDASVDLLFPIPKTFEALRDDQLDFVVGSAHATLLAFPEWQGAKLRIPIEDDAVLMEDGVQFVHAANYRLLVVK